MSFIGGIAYADDLLLLLSSSLTMLQLMLDVCCDTGMLYDLMFNPSKTMCGIVGVSLSQHVNCLSLSGIIIKWSSTMVYLGITFCLVRVYLFDLTNRLVKYHAAVSAVLKEKLWGFEHVYVKVLITKYLPILLYGVDSLTINCKV